MDWPPHRTHHSHLMRHMIYWLVFVYAWRISNTVSDRYPLDKHDTLFVSAMLAIRLYSGGSQSIYYCLSARVFPHRFE